MTMNESDRVEPVVIRGDKNFADSAASAMFPQDRRERVPDPGMRVAAPDSLLAAIGNCHINLTVARNRLHEMVLQLGAELAAENVVDPPMMTALDYMRHNCNLSWQIEGLLDCLFQIVGVIETRELAEGGTELIRMG